MFVDLVLPYSDVSPVKGFFTDTRKALSIQCYTHVGVGQNLISCVSPNAIINQPMHVYIVNMFTLR